MKERHALWDALTSGNSRTPRTENQREALYRYNIIMLCERFGWTPDVVTSLPFDFYQDLIAVINLRDSKQQSSPPQHGRK